MINRIFFWETILYMNKVGILQYRFVNVCCFNQLEYMNLENIYFSDKTVEMDAE